MSTIATARVVDSSPWRGRRARLREVLELELPRPLDVLVRVSAAGSREPRIGSYRDHGGLAGMPELLRRRQVLKAAAEELAEERLALDEEVLELLAGEGVERVTAGRWRALRVQRKEVSHIDRDRLLDLGVSKDDIEAATVVEKVRISDEGLAARGVAPETVRAATVAEPRAPYLDVRPWSREDVREERGRTSRKARAVAAGRLAQAS